MENGISVGDALALSNRHNNDYGYGYGDWMWIIILFALFGWGKNDRGVDPAAAAASFEGSATRNTVTNGFQFDQLDGGIRSLANGLCDGFYALNTSVKDGTYATTDAIKDTRYQLGSAIADCCCTTQRNIDSVRYDMAKGFCDVITAGQLNTRDIIESQTAGTQKILDYLCANEKAALRDRIGTLELSAALQAQASAIVGQVRPYPTPAFSVPNPYGASFGCGCGGCGYGY